MGITQGRAVLRAFFGTGTGRAVFDLPGRIDTLLSFLPPGHQYTAERLLYDHTLLPYYTPFLPSDRVTRAERTMRSGNPSTIHGILGLRSSRIPLSHPYRFCQECVKVDRLAFGCAYWHRSHQLPGVFVCSTHEVPLREHQLDPRPPYEFLSLERALSVGRGKDTSSSPLPDSLLSDSPLWSSIAVHTANLLKDSIAPVGLDSIYRAYHTLLDRRGWKVSPKHIRISDFRTSFQGSIGRTALNALNCDLPAGRAGWLERLLRKPRTASHPLHHLLVLEFLHCSPREFFVRCRESTPSYHSRNSSLDRSNSGPDSGEFVPGATSQSPKWESQLIALVRTPDRSLRSIARELQVDPRTVQRHARRLNVWRPMWTTWDKVAPATKRVEATAERRARYRSEWISLREEHPTEGTTMLRERAAAVYAFLYRVDRDWLSAHKPSSPNRPRIPKRVDWRNRDRELCLAAKEVADALRDRPGRPVWIQRSTILRRLGSVSLFFAHQNLLPKTRTFLATMAEARVDYARKKIANLVEEFAAQNKSPQHWEFLRHAALRPDLADHLSNEITEVLSKIRRFASNPDA